MHQHDHTCTDSLHDTLVIQCMGNHEIIPASFIMMIVIQSQKMTVSPVFNQHRINLSIFVKQSQIINCSSAIPRLIVNGLQDNLRIIYNPEYILLPKYLTTHANNETQKQHITWNFHVTDVILRLSATTGRGCGLH